MDKRIKRFLLDEHMSLGIFNELYEHRLIEETESAITLYITGKTPPVHCEQCGRLSGKHRDHVLKLVATPIQGKLTTLIETRRVYRCSHCEITMWPQSPFFYTPYMITNGMARYIEHLLTIADTREIIGATGLSSMRLSTLKSHFIELLNQQVQTASAKSSPLAGLAFLPVNRQPNPNMSKACSVLIVDTVAMRIVEVAERDDTPSILESVARLNINQNQIGFISLLPASLFADFLQETDLPYHHTAIGFNGITKRSKDLEGLTYPMTPVNARHYLESAGIVIPGDLTDLVSNSAIIDVDTFEGLKAIADEQQQQIEGLGFTIRGNVLRLKVLKSSYPTLTLQE